MTSAIARLVRLSRMSEHQNKPRPAPDQPRTPRGETAMHDPGGHLARGACNVLGRRCVAQMAVCLLSASTNASYAVSPSGPVAGWGDIAIPYLEPGAVLTNITAGAGHALAITSKGAAVAWGYNTSQQAIPPFGLANVVSVAGGDTHSLALKADGTVVAWGGNNYGQINVPPGLSNVVAITAGDSYSEAVKGDGTVVTWGLAGSAQTTVPPGLSNVITIKSLVNHTRPRRRPSASAARPRSPSLRPR